MITSCFLDDSEAGSGLGEAKVYGAQAAHPVPWGG